MSRARLLHKRGDTLTLPATYVDEGGPVSLSGYTISCQIRRANGQLLASLTATIDPDQATNPGKFVLSATAAVTATWKPGDYLCDIQFAPGGSVYESSETFDVIVEEDITR